jgi:hypothetical protein
MTDDVWGVWDANVAESLKSMGPLAEIVATFWKAQIENGMSTSAATQVTCALVAATMTPRPGGTK